MKERPILFKGEMVRAVLDGRKTVTRRVVNTDVLRVIPRRNTRGDGPFGSWECKGGQKTQAQMNGCGAVSGKATNGEWLGLKPGEFDFVSPYCCGTTELVDDHWHITPEHDSRMWVRECFAAYGEFAKYGTGRVTYRADYPDGAQPQSLSWKPSIHMPRWASRITLEVVSVRVERVQDITEEDAIAEGISEEHDWDGTWYGTGERGCSDATALFAFMRLWDSINAKRDGGIYSWASNPWVWRVEFKRITP